MNKIWKWFACVVLLCQCIDTYARDSWFAAENRYTLEVPPRIKKALEGGVSFETVMANFREKAENVPEGTAGEIVENVSLLADEHTHSEASDWLIDNNESAVPVMIVEYEALDNPTVRLAVIELLADEDMMSAIKKQHLEVVVFLLDKCYASELQIRARALTSIAAYKHAHRSNAKGVANWILLSFVSMSKWYPPYYVLQMHVGEIFGAPSVMTIRRSFTKYRTKKPAIFAETETPMEFRQGGIDVSAIRNRADEAADMLLNLAADSKGKLADAVRRRIVDLGNDEMRDDAIDWFRTTEGPIAPLLVREYRTKGHDAETKRDILDLLRYDNLKSARGKEYADEIVHFLLGHLLADDAELQHDTILFMGVLLSNHRIHKRHDYIDEIKISEKAFRHVSHLVTHLARLRSEGPYGLLQRAAAAFVPKGDPDFAEKRRKIPEDLLKRRGSYFLKMR